MMVVKQLMEIEADGSGPAHGKKRPRSPSDGDEELSKYATRDDDDELLISDSDGEDGDGQENQGKINPLFLISFA